MRKRLTALLAVLCTLAMLISCAPVAKNPSADQANAYFLVFEHLYNEDQGLNGGKYIAVDLTKAKVSDTAPLIDLLKGFCDTHHYTLMLDTFEGLKQKGYIKDLNFAQGILFTFNDQSLGETSLVTSAQKWRSGLGAIGADYAVEKKNGKWEITSVYNGWIS